MLFTVIWGVYESARVSTMMETGNKSNITLEKVNIDDFDKISKSLFIEDSEKVVILGSITNIQSEDLEGKVVYCDSEYMEEKFIYLEEGKMPVSNNEILVSKKVLKLLNSDYDIGSKFNIKIELNNHRYIEKEFVISGVYDTKTNFKYNDFIISKNLCDSLTDSLTTEEKDIGEIELKLKNTFFIEKQIENIRKEMGDNNIKVNINWTYKYVYSHELSCLIILLILLIMLSGYLIIYNIFNMSVTNNIKFYGMLKTLGTTNKQIERILYFQAVIYMLLAIPLGLFGGCELGKKTLPMINNILMDNILISIETTLKVNPLIFVLVLLFTAKVVFLSLKNTCKLMRQIKPIEAIKYNGIDEESNCIMVKKIFNTKGKLYEIPFINIIRNRKKVIILVMSVSISFILFNILFNIVSRFDKENYINENMEINYDYKIDNRYFVSMASNEIENNTGISSGLIDELKENRFINDSGGLFILNADKCITNESLENDISIFAIDDFFIRKYSKNDMVKRLNEKNYIILSDNINGYKVGDIIKIKEEDSLEEFEVIGFLDFFKYFNLNINSSSINGVISKNKINTKKMKLERYYFDMNSNINSEDIDNILLEYIKENDRDITYKSKESIEKRYDTIKKYYEDVGIVIVIVVGMIGVLNYTNSIFTEILLSAKMFAVIEALGVTKREIKIMLAIEGLYYSIMTTTFQIIFVIIFKFICAKDICSIWPIMISTPILMLISIVIPILLYSKILENDITNYLRIF